jgi:hypothetical protein
MYLLFQTPLVRLLNPVERHRDASPRLGEIEIVGRLDDGIGGADLGNPLVGGLTLGVYGAAGAMPVLVLAMAPSVGRSGTGLVARLRHTA